MKNLHLNPEEPTARILIADDEQEDLDALSALLTNKGYKVSIASNGAATITQAQTIRPDLILLDISMPGIHGGKASQDLKANVKTRDIPTILIEANNNLDREVEALTYSGVDYITKPFHPAEVLVRVDNQLTICKLRSHLSKQNIHVKQVILDQNLALEALQRSNSLLSAQQEAAIEGILAVDEQGHIVSYNHRFCEMWHISKELLESGESQRLLSVLLSQSQLPESLINLLESAYDRPDEIMRGEVSYENRSYDCYSSPVISPENKYFGLVWHFCDISDRKQAEVQQSQLLAELKHAKEAAELAARAKADFLAVMSHEIRTPINGVLGMTQLLAATELTAEQQKFVNIAQVSGEILLTVINDILDFSKIESGKLELERQPLAIRVCLQEVCDLLTVKAAEKNLNLYYQVASDVPNYIAGDATRLRQILLNLVNNAIKFTAEGEVRIFVRLQTEVMESNSSVTATSDMAKVSLLFAVKDTGIGIPKDKIERLFKPFSQADLATTRKYGGTGLGLAICDRLVGLMGGEIWVESELEKGSTFLFTIQTHVVNALPPNSLQVQQSRPSKLDAKLGERIPLNILVAEDNPINQEFALAMIVKMGYEVDIVGNGRLAIEAIQKKEYNILLLDVQMPEMDGLETSSYLVNNWQNLGLAYPRPKIIAMTASACQDDREKCFEAGMDDYISKPIVIDVMQHMLGKWGWDRGTASEREDNYISSAAIIDDVAIQRIREINPDLVQRMVRLFLQEEAPRLLHKLGQSLQASNLQEMQDIAHSLKGSSRVLGATGLANLCEQIELKLKKNELQELDSLLQQIENTYQQVQRELSKLL